MPHHGRLDGVGPCVARLVLADDAEHFFSALDIVLNLAHVVFELLHSLVFDTTLCLAASPGVVVRYSRIRTLTLNTVLCFTVL